MELSIAFPELYDEIKDIWNDVRNSYKFKKVQTYLETEINQFNQFYMSMKEEFEKYLSID